MYFGSDFFCVHQTVKGNRINPAGTELNTVHSIILQQSNLLHSSSAESLSNTPSQV